MSWRRAHLGWNGRPLRWAVFRPGKAARHPSSAYRFMGVIAWCQSLRWSGP